jgi:hypothetical protein
MGNTCRKRQGHGEDGNGRRKLIGVDDGGDNDNERVEDIADCVVGGGGW